MPGEALWHLPDALLSTQTLYRAQGSSPAGEAKVRLTLRLADPAHFTLAVADPFGRALWSVAVADASALFLDHRGSVYCRLATSDPLPDPSLGIAGIGALPALLLGRLPVAPAPPDTLVSANAGGELAYGVGAGRRLTATLDAAGTLRTWTLWEGDQPLTWWQRDGDGGVLNVRRPPSSTGRLPTSGSFQLRWQMVVREALTDGAALGTLATPPADYGEGVCDGRNLH